jgi:hypothetical protein
MTNEQVSTWKGTVVVLRLSRRWCFKSTSSSTDLRNAGILPQHYTTSQPRRHRLETIVACFKKPHIGQTIEPCTSRIQVYSRIILSGITLNCNLQIRTNQLKGITVHLFLTCYACFLSRRQQLIYRRTVFKTSIKSRLLAVGVEHVRVPND